MNISKTWRLGGFVAALGASAALVASASGATGAYFNDTKAGTVGGTIGSIKVTTTSNGGNASRGADGNLNFHFDNLLPGSPQNANVEYTNSGKNTEDVYLVFPNAAALHAVNNMGTYGEVHVKSNGNAVFDSTNLNDSLDANLADDGHCSQTIDGCWALPNVIKLGTVEPGGQGTMDFSFGLAAKWKNTATEETQALCYPLVYSGDGNPADQTCTGTGQQYGLPYEIVATQQGVSPSDALNSHPTP
jgi:hypothetical protein